MLTIDSLFLIPPDIGGSVSPFAAAATWQQADAPTPYLAVNICPSTVSGRYVVSATACGTPISGDGSAQTIALNPVLLVNGVSYVPSIVRSATIGMPVSVFARCALGPFHGIPRNAVAH